MAYLYGFEQFDFTDEDLDSETMQCVFVFMAVMFGVQGATSALRILSDTVAKQVAKKIEKKALTKGTLYPIVKKSLLQLISV